MRYLVTALLIGLVIVHTGSAADAPIAFQDVTHAAGLTRSGQSYGASWGDFNGDGYPDLWVGNHGDPPGIYRNNRNGTFTNVTAQMWGGRGGDTHGAAWADFDNDGDEDLLELVGGNAPNNFFVNERTRFVERSVAHSLDIPPSRGRTPVWFDFDRDGWLDVLVTRETGPVLTPIIMRNTGTRFEDVGFLAGLPDINSNIAYLADLTEDGSLDLIFSNGSPGSGPIYLTDTMPFTLATTAQFPALPPRVSCYDSVIADFNGDTRLDIFSVCSGGIREVARCGPGCLKAIMVVTKTEHALEFSASAPVTITVMPTTPMPATEFVRIGASSVIPVTASTADLPGLSYRFVLDPADQRMWGKPMHVAGANRGLYVSYDAAASRWRVAFSWTDATTIGLVITSNAAVQDPVAVGFSATPAASQPFYSLRTSNGFANALAGSGLAQPLPCPSVVGGDFDNDGDVDLFLLCSHVITNVPDRLFLNDGSGHFTEVPAAGGAAGTSVGSGDSVTTVDYDNDGFLDLFVTNGRGLGSFANGPNQLFRNLGNGNNWLALDLKGTVSNRSAIGAIVRVRAGGKDQIRVVDGGMHLHAQNHKRIHVGLGSNQKADEVEIRWPSGATQKMLNVPANWILPIVEHKPTGTCGSCHARH